MGQGGDGTLHGLRRVTQRGLCCASVHGVLAERLAAELLATASRTDGRTWRLVGRLDGGRKAGAWEVQDRDGNRAVLKWFPYAGSPSRLEESAALVRRARAAGWPTPAWHSWGVTGEGRPYVLTEYVEGEAPERLDDSLLDALLDVVERQRHIAGSSSQDWAAYIWRSVFSDSSRWRAALARHSPDAQAAGDSIARLAAPFAGVRLADGDLVHMDFGLQNLLVRNGALVAVVDLEGIGRGAAAIDLVTLLFSAHGNQAATERTLDRLVAHALARDGGPVLSVCLAGALFDWCIYATGGWEPAAVAAYLVRAASLFARLR
jgi:aminoglycoside phosphotransferase (APT) family kinase protein